MGFWTRRRLLYGLTAVAMLSITGGFAFASTLTSTTVGQSASLYSISTSGVAAFPSTPTVQVSSTLPSVTTCTSSPVALASGGSAWLFLPASSGVTCSTGDFAVIFNFTSSATASAGSYSFTIYDSYGSGPTTGSAAGTVTVGSPLSSPGTVSVYVDFGSSSPPAGGISSLSLVVG